MSSDPPVLLNLLQIRADDSGLSDRRGLRPDLPARRHTALLHALLWLAEAVLPDGRPEAAQKPQRPLPGAPDILGEDDCGADAAFHQVSSESREGVSE